MPGPSLAEIAAMYASQQTSGTEGTMTETLTEPAAEPVKLNLQDQTIPHNAWQPLAEEITEVETGKLVEALIAYINKMDFPPRFRNAAQALAYFEIMSEATITRINEIANKLANPEPVEEESAA